MFSTKYTLKPVQVEYSSPGFFRYYHDLDHDGTSELIILYTNPNDDISVSVSTLDYKTINQFNLNGQLLRLGESLEIHDINQDGIDDIFICTYNAESILLSIIDDVYSSPTTFRQYIVEHTDSSIEDKDFFFFTAGFEDLSGDGIEEYIFGINGGYSLHPRRVYSIDYMSNEVLKSPVSGAAITGAQLFDLNCDGVKEILINTAAPENYKSHIPYRDSVAWLMLLDNNLEYYIPPIQIGKSPSWVYIVPFTHDSIPHLLVYKLYRGAEQEDPTLYLFDNRLQLITSRSFPFISTHPHIIWKATAQNSLQDINIISSKGIYKIDLELNYIDSLTKAEASLGTFYSEFDLNDDGKTELITFNLEKLSVFSPYLNLMAISNLGSAQPYTRVLFSIIEEQGIIRRLFLQADQNQYTFEYLRNQFYRFRTLIFLCMSIVLFLLMHAVISVEKRIATKKILKERQNNQLQLLAIKNHLDPHFTFNTLNAIGSLIFQEKKELAYHYLRELTEILRSVAYDSIESVWTLEEELEYVIKYLELEKLRFKERFSYEVNNMIKSEKEYIIPRMSILTFVENAFKHGLELKKDNKFLGIDINEYPDNLSISITDNGIGRQAAEAKNGKPGKGIEMLTQYFELVGSVTGINANFTVVDNYSEANLPTGTTIILKIKW